MTGKRWGDLSPTALHLGTVSKGSTEFHLSGPARGAIRVSEGGSKWPCGLQQNYTRTMLPATQARTTIKFACSPLRKGRLRAPREQIQLELSFLSACAREQHEVGDQAGCAL